MMRKKKMKESNQIDLPELNRDAIDENAKEIQFNRRLIIVVAILIMGLLTWTNQTLSHDMHDCETKLFEKLTGMKYPDLKDK